MKNLTAIATGVIVIFLSASAEAQSMSACKDISTAAGVIMTHRQEINDMSEALSFADRVDGEQFVDLTIELVKLAYAEPRYSTENYKLEAVNDFKNEVLLTCLE